MPLPCRACLVDQERPDAGSAAQQRAVAINPPPDSRPRLGRPALVALLVATGVLYLWGLGASGWANTFYSAAVQAGTKSWKAFFFGSSDAANFITVDKPPAALWVMELSARLFGVNAWSILVPEALEGVAAVGLLYADGAAVVRRRRPALLAGAVLALTPVAALDVPLQQPRRPARPAAHRRGLRHGPGPRGGPHPVADPGRDPRRFRVPHQDAPGPPGRARLRPRLPDRRADPAAAAGSVQLLVAGAALVVSSLWWVVAVMARARRAAARTSAARRTTASGT